MQTKDAGVVCPTLCLVVGTMDISCLAPQRSPLVSCPGDLPAWPGFRSLPRLAQPRAPGKAPGGRPDLGLSFSSLVTLNASQTKAAVSVYPN